MNHSPQTTINFQRSKVPQRSHYSPILARRQSTHFYELGSLLLYQFLQGDRKGDRQTHFLGIESMQKFPLFPVVRNLQCSIHLKTNTSDTIVLFLRKYQSLREQFEQYPELVLKQQEKCDRDKRSLLLVPYEWIKSL